MTKYKVGMLNVLVARVSLSNLRLRDRGKYHPIVGATDSASHSTGEILFEVTGKGEVGAICVPLLLFSYNLVRNLAMSSETTILTKRLPTRFVSWHCNLVPFFLMKEYRR